MVKKIIAVATAFLMLCCMIPFGAFADVLDACPKCGERTYVQETGLTVDACGIGVTYNTKHCTSCRYSYYEWSLFGRTGYKEFESGVGDNLVADFISEWIIDNFGKDVRFTKFESGGGSTSGGGVGRNPDGYTDDNGTPSVGKDGTFALSGSYSFLGYSTYGGSSLLDNFTFDCSHSWQIRFGYKTYSNFYTTYSNGAVSVSGHLTSDASAYRSFSPIMAAYYFVAPHDGYYTVSAPTASVVASVKLYDGSYTDLGENNFQVSYAVSHKESNGLYSCTAYNDRNDGANHATLTYSRDKSPYSFGGYSKKMYFTKGSVYLVLYRVPELFELSNSKYVYGNITLKTSAPTWNAEVFEDIDSTVINKQTNITINNNTWNGNIYTDNSTNLTYIYPQYTTINEKNETVTNISNTPIIYNNETKQYYTYDTVTNNYYYITYEQPATPTPSPSPSPAPTETPSPSESPTPTPTPDPGTAPTPTPKPGGSISTPETGKPGGDTGDTTGILAVLVEIRDNMIQGFLDIKAAFVAGFAELSANFTLAIENLNVNIQNIFNKKFPDQSTPETALPSPTPSPSPAPLDPILPETQNLIIPKMNSNTFTDEHGTWVASGSSKYSDVFDFFHAFDRSTSDFWETNAKPSYLQIEIPDPESYYIDGYIMRISKFNNRYAKEWTLQGSDDGKTWDDLDTQKGQNLSDMEEHKYSLTLRKAYKYYRLNMSNYASSMCSLSHFNLLGYDAKDVVTPTPAPTEPSSPTPSPSPAPTGKPDGGGDTNNFWNIFIGGGSDDGTDGDHKGIFWALVSLILALIAFFTNLFAGVAYLFPFLPEGVVMTINTCLFVVFLFVIIKFIMRSK